MQEARCFYILEVARTEKKEVLSDLGAKLAKLLSKQYNKEVCDIGKNRLRIYEKDYALMRKPTKINKAKG